MQRRRDVMVQLCFRHLSPNPSNSYIAISPKEGGPQYRPRNGTSKMVPLILGNPHMRVQPCVLEACPLLMAKIFSDQWATKCKCFQPSSPCTPPPKAQAPHPKLLSLSPIAQPRAFNPRVQNQWALQRLCCSALHRKTLKSYQRITSVP